MSQNKNQNKVAAALRQYAEKVAAEKSAAGEGAPDRLTTADGQGGITASRATIPADVGAAELRRDQPANGAVRGAASVPAGAPDRMTVADGQGGITAGQGTVPTDPGEAELKRDQPADGSVRKAATISGRAAGIRNALVQANPNKFKKEAAPAAYTQAAAHTQAPAAPAINMSTDTLAKIARAILSTDAGVSYAHDTLEKQAGADAARAQIQEAIQASHSFDQTEQIKSAAFDDVANSAHNIHESLLQNGISEDDADQVIKQAAFHQTRIDSLEHPMLKAAYAQGMDDAALLAAADEAAGEEGVPPVEEAMPMGGPELGEEEIMGLLTEMLESGQISEEDILEAVAATEGGEVMPEGGGLPEEALAPEMVPV